MSVCYRKAVIRDARRTPIKVGGYALKFSRAHVLVRIERETFKTIKGEFIRLALRRSAEDLEAALLQLPFEPYEPIRRQLFEIVRAVNKARQPHGLEPVSKEAVRWGRRICRPFESPGASVEASDGVTEAA